MQDVEIQTAATDRRPILPSVLVSSLGVTAAESEELADEVGARLVGDADLCGRPLWRETVTEQLVGPGRQNLLLSRWPIEDDPPVVSVIDGGALDVAEYEVSGEGRHALYRRFGWAWSASRADPYTGDPASASTLFHYTTTYTAGWLMPGQVSTFAPDIVVQKGGSASYGEDVGWIRPTDRSIALRFEVTLPASGKATMDTLEPTWPATVGDTVVSGAVTLTARRAVEMPSVQSSLLKLAASIDDERPPDLKREKFKDHELEYRDGDGIGNLAMGLRALR